MARVLFYEKVGSHGTRLPSGKGIRILERSKGRYSREEALGIASKIVEAIKPRCKKIAIAGSLRRGKLFIGDVDIVAVPLSGLDPLGLLGLLDQGSLAFEEQGSTKCVLSYRLAGTYDDGERVIRIDVRLVPPRSWGAALQYLTGSKLHNICLRALAKERGWRLNEYGLWDGERQIAGTTEGGIYKALGLRWLPPRFREGPFHFKKTTHKGGWPGGE